MPASAFARDVLLTLFVPTAFAAAAAPPFLRRTAVVAGGSAATDDPASGLALRREGAVTGFAGLLMS
ncbi:hypothetical protein [Komagataeibacter saccharivorans]|uniref:hypothetical protein n=1 Tax=Komagataeibacter saccharivorans TaxID=265959 RepID=UPI00104CEF29|nr:hypothetical protein [Komagataeibacter saccharivorans]